jgi:DNA-binding response OmpR family regulator
MPSGSHELQVAGAPDGHATEHGPADLVVLDGALAGAELCAWCRKVRASPAGEDAVLLVVGTEDDLAGAISGGADDFDFRRAGPDILQMRLHMARSTAERRAESPRCRPGFLQKPFTPSDLAAKLTQVQFQKTPGP